MSKKKVILFSLVLMVVLQAARMALEQLIFLFAARDNFTDTMASALAMLILTAALLFFVKKRREPLSFFSKKFGALYIAATFVFIALIVADFIIMEEGSLKALAILISSCVATPLYEEIIFRGYLWNKFEEAFQNKWAVFALTTLLFALWHLGYIDTVAFRAQGNLAWLMMWKTITGLCFGIVLGAVRIKTKDCYLTVLLHGAMNIFGR